MIKLEETLKLNRCPHCSVDKPNLESIFNTFTTNSDNSTNSRRWNIYKCIRCGGVVTAGCNNNAQEVSEIYPAVVSVNPILPGKVGNYLQQAIESVHSPAGSVILCASAVDAMLKAKNLIEGSLYNRINKAVDDGILTKEMATWAHQIRLDANDERHADYEAIDATTKDALLSIEFAKTLAEFLFILPSKVTQGLENSKKSK